MIELYIENQKIDLTDDIEINFTYETIDPDKLSSIKNSFSKTVNIPGTPNNNRTFGYIFRFDKYFNSLNTGRIGNDYDPHKKVNWFINKNGSLINRGYCTLDNIKVKNDYEYTYQLTLYGGLGEFFYNLAYNEDGSEKTLYDLFWNWFPKLNIIDEYGPATTKENENNTLLYVCEPAQVASSYSKLNPYYRATGSTYIDRDVVFVPCYTGLYEDFDSKSMLVATALQKEAAVPGAQTISDNMRTILSGSFPDSMTQDGKTYTALNRNLDSTGLETYGLVKFSRDLDPFEAGEMRINETPIAIRLSKLMEVISNPINNGGYIVEWDDVIKSSPYWLYSWIMLDKLTVDKREKKAYDFELTDKDTCSIEFNDTTCDAFNHQYFTKTLYDGPVEQGTYYAITNYDPSVVITVPFNYNLTPNWNKYRSMAHNQRISVGPHGSSHSHAFESVYNTFVILTTVKFNNSILKTIADVIFYTSDTNTFPRLAPGTADELKPIWKEYLDNAENLPHNIDEVNIYNLTTDDVSYQEAYGYAVVVGKYDTQQFSHIIELTSYGDLTIKQYGVVCWLYNFSGSQPGVTTNISEAGIYGITPPYSDRSFTNMKTFWSLPSSSPTESSQWEFTSHVDPYTFEMTTNQNQKNGLYTKSSSGFSPIRLYKNVLFANTQSPMKYLSGFCKLMNYRFICDNTEKKVYIKDLKNYYINNIYDLTDRIDLSRDININSVTAKYKHINIGLETPSTYPVSLFNKSSKDKFNTERYHTNIEYPLPDTELLNDLIFQNTIEWQQSSVFYNIYPQCAKGFNTTTISWNLFNVNRESEDVKVQSQQFFTLGVPATEDTLLASNDWFPKQALFSNDNKSVDFEASLLFLNGFVKNYDYVKVPQNISEEFTNIKPTTVEADKTIDDSGEIIQDANQHISEYYFDSSKKYFITASFTDAAYGNDQTYVVNYYDVNNNWLGGEYTKAEVYRAGGFDKVEILNIPPLAYTIYCVTPTAQTNPLYTKQETYAYVISPRLLLSQDNFEQYYLNQDRCYQYDFGYSIKDWYSWGFAPKTVGGSATSWVLPMFSKDLYNTYTPKKTYEIEEPYDVLNNTYISSTGTEETDNNFEVLQYNVDSDKQYKFSAKYSFDWSGIAVAYYNEDNQFISSEYNVTAPQTEFNDVVLTIPTNATKMYVNVQKVLSGQAIVKVLSDNIGWHPTAQKVASWNFTYQNGLDSLYTLMDTNFVINPQFNYNMLSQSINYISNNEYKIGYWPQDEIGEVNESRIFDTKWKDYLDDLYDRNAKDVVAYVDLSGFGDANNIMRNIYSWKSHLWIINKLENFKIAETTHDKFTKVTMHKIKDISTWVNTYIPQVETVEIEYLETDGQQYIDTSVHPSNTINYEVKIRILSTSTAESGDKCGLVAAINDVTTETTNDNFAFNTYITARLSTLSAEDNLTNDQFDQAGILPNFTYTFKVEDRKLYSNGNLRWTSPSTSTYRFDDITYGLLRANTKAGFVEVDNAYKCRIYGAKFWDGDTLIRDYIPVRIGSTGALYDKVTGGIYYNRGTGQFTLGPDKN